MAFGAVSLIPGIDTERTQTLNQAGFSNGNMIRWKDGLVEKIGGWTRYYAGTVGSIPRTLWGWQDLNTNLRLAVGATASLSVITSGALVDLTPQQTTTNSAVDFSTTNTSTAVTIVDANISNPNTNSFVFINTPVAVGGIVLYGIYAVATIISPTSYTITAASAATSTVANGGAVRSYATTISLAIVTVTLANHGYVVGQNVYHAVSTTVGGITIFGNYIIQTVPTANTYTISAANTATATTSGSENGGNCQFIYYIAIGPQATTSGYGTGTYGSGGYGTGTAPPSGSGTPITATDWSLGNWGEILLANPKGGAIYQWSPSGGFLTAQLVSGAPISSVMMFVTMPQQIVVALGASRTGAPSPMDVRWSAAGDYTVWTATSSNLAGSFTIPRGSQIVGGLQAQTQNLIWTDLAVWSMQFINLPNVFGFNEIMTGCGLIGGHAATVVGSAVYWMSQKQFFRMPSGGGPQPLPCKVWDFIFQDLDTTNAYKIRAGGNAAFNEVWWHFPSSSGGTGENDSYVKYNYVEGEWDCGQLPTGRSAWIDQSVLGAPIGGDPTGLIFQHEQGYDGDGAAIVPYVVTGYWVADEAENFIFTDYFLPDFRFGLFNGSSQGATVLVTLFALDEPNGTARSYGPFSVTSTTPSFQPRARGRQFALLFASQDAGSFWRIGKNRYRWAIDGRVG